ncbi:hypothetical protein HK096_006609 [Nowakowskiella sp. JEL0078]|nr:hypothetical protein HK096_006609 [Nowakowskiella sp. JEL0078]
MFRNSQPEEVLMKIFKYLNVYSQIPLEESPLQETWIESQNSLLNCALVCKRWAYPAVYYLWNSPRLNGRMSHLDLSRSITTIHDQELFGIDLYNSDNKKMQFDDELDYMNLLRAICKIKLSNNSNGVQYSNCRLSSLILPAQTIPVVFKTETTMTPQYSDVEAREIMMQLIVHSSEIKSSLLQSDLLKDDWIDCLDSETPIIPEALNGIHSKLKLESTLWMMEALLLELCPNLIFLRINGNTYLHDLRAILLLQNLAQNNKEEHGQEIHPALRGVHINALFTEKGWNLLGELLDPENKLNSFSNDEKKNQKDGFKLFPSLQNVYFEEFSDLRLFLILMKKARSVSCNWIDMEEMSVDTDCFQLNLDKSQREKLASFHANHSISILNKKVEDLLKSNLI